MKEFMCVRTPWVDLEQVLSKAAKKGWTVLELHRCLNGSYEIVFERVKE